MFNPESAPDLNNPESNSKEAGEGINVVENIESESEQEELAKSKLEIKEEQEAEELKLMPEEQFEDLENEIDSPQQEIAKLTESIQETKAKLNEAREKLRLPPTEEEPPSVLLDKEKLTKLQSEQEALGGQKEDFISQKEKEQLIAEEKEKILQEKIDELFEEFSQLSSVDFESLFRSGKTSGGRVIESRAMGSLDPEIAQSLARAFKEGIKLLPKILEILPELQKRFDEDLTNEATERVEQKLKEEKQEMEESIEELEQEEKQEPEILENEVLPDGINLEQNSNEGENKI